jgi:hypothetical protein
MAVNTFAEYQDQITVEETQALYDKASRQDSFSEVFASAAIAIWITDLTWITVTTSGLEKTPLYTTSRGLSVGTTVEPFTLTPMVGIRYCF